MQIRDGSGSRARSANMTYAQRVRVRGARALANWPRPDSPRTLPHSGPPRSGYDVCSERSGGTTATASTPRRTPARMVEIGNAAGLCSEDSGVSVTSIVV
jgi:hypothetical protein